MPASHQWHHAKHDCLLPRFVEGVSTRLALPTPRLQPKAVVQAAFDGTHWWCNGNVWPANAEELQQLWGARVIVNSKVEWLALVQTLGPDIQGVVLDEWFDDGPRGVSLHARIEQLQTRLAHCQHQLRVDFREHPSILSAWKWRNIRRIKKDWPFELQSTHQWMQSIDDRAWQEARMAYDTRDRAGAVLDIRSAYASAVQSMPFPKPGAAWKQLRAGQRHPDALHCVVWEPGDLVGRFYHPFWYSVQGVHGQPAYNAGDGVHAWVLDEDLAWLARHGTVRGVYQSVAPASMQMHPLASSIGTWKELLAQETQPGYRALHKMRLVSAHSWTWQPREIMLAADAKTLALHALEEYSSRPASRVGGIRLNEDKDIGLVAQGNDGLESGWYTPVAWLRLKLRSHMMRRVEHALDHGLDIAYISVDGMHVRGLTAEQIQTCHDGFVDPLAPWWQWRVDKTFSKGIWFRAGAYALQDEQGQWNCTNLPEIITGRDWNLWCQSRGTLDARKNVGYWRRPNIPERWDQLPSIALNAQRRFRSLVRQELHR